MKNILILSIFALFLVTINSLKAQEITQFIGVIKNQYYVDDVRVKGKDINQLMLNNAAANLHWKKAKTADIVFGISFAVNTVTSLVVYDQLLRDKTPAGGLYALAIGSGIIEIWSELRSLSRKKKAILEYNSGFDKKEKVSLVPLGNQNGIGLALKF